MNEWVEASKSDKRSSLLQKKRDVIAKKYVWYRAHKVALEKYEPQRYLKVTNALAYCFKI